MKHAIPMLLLALTLVHGLAQASDKSVTTIPVKGLIDECQRFASVRTIRQMGTDSARLLAPGRSLAVAGPDNPMTPDSSRETATLHGTRTRFGFRDSTTPVDFIVLRDAVNMVIHYYPSGGVTSDDNLQLLVNGMPLPVDEINLCYGLGNLPSGPEEPPPQQPIATSCPLDNNCPNDGERRLLCRISLGDEGVFSGGVTANNCCVCNGDPLPPCDPTLLGGQPGTCLGTSGTGTAEVPTTIELNEDPYVCTTSGGKRTCYQY